MKNEKRKEWRYVMKRYFDDPRDDIAFERCVDVLAELIEKYAGLFALNDIGYEYYVIFASTPIATSLHSFEGYTGRCRWYRNRFELKRNVINHNAKNQIDRIVG
ncbi:MAG: hypothetical protein IJ065_11220 [Eubacterium sp.]|nr:hypothetical protein [Eubacterium sp.]